MPVGPHILCADATSQSAPSCCTSTGMLGTLWQASTSSLPPTCDMIQQSKIRRATLSMDDATLQGQA